MGAYGMLPRAKEERCNPRAHAYDLLLWLAETKAERDELADALATLRAFVAGLTLVDGHHRRAAVLVVADTALRAAGRLGEEEALRIEHDRLNHNPMGSLTPEEQERMVALRRELTGTPYEFMPHPWTDAHEAAWRSIYGENPDTPL